ncbi:carboxypeptidase-like regulatory domain-containing protein [Flavobacterium sp. NST-5]|uniref:Carboxypeptidase-like regulatory domain-containing protein n=1 Tax=Flavobacterium ichthyis TaxID=2698827 RepID=A0ABW9ZAR1_9FLAO|nr:carboxypeptidase-like regulatory domain-containing protein [Flavobacterium ichthyis]NBL65776.1 carboxypeptidase-like regulatory domain-containing protein [Flavobacterium ichthyis]
MKTTTIILFLLQFSLCQSQIRGTVVDEFNQPIPYVNIYVEDENIGTNSEENGTFMISVQENKNLVFSALGFQTKIVPSAEAKTVMLQAEAVNIGEVLITNRKNSREQEIGGYRKALAQTYDNGPKRDAKFFAYEENYSKTRWIKSATIITDNKIEGATLRLQLFAVDENGFPGEELLDKNYIITLKKGVHRTEADLTDYHLEMPKNGVFVMFEKLLIEKNKLETVIKDANRGTEKTKIHYQPFVLYNAVEKDFLFSFTGGKWIKQTPEELNPNAKSKTVLEPSVTLKLTN